MNDYNQVKFDFWNDINIMDFRTQLMYLVGEQSSRDFDYYCIKLLCGEHEI